MEKWFKHVSDSMFMALCAVFGLEINSADALKRFIPAYIENATNTQLPRDVNACYYTISETQNTDFDYVQIRRVVSQGNPLSQTATTIPLSVLFTFYGPDADDDAEMFWQRIQQDLNSSSARAILRGRRIVPMGKPSRPVSLYETEGTFHRRRSDVRMGFAYLMITNESVGHVDEPPVIGIVINN